MTTNLCLANNDVAALDTDNDPARFGLDYLDSEFCALDTSRFNLDMGELGCRCVYLDHQRGWGIYSAAVGGNVGRTNTQVIAASGRNRVVAGPAVPREVVRTAIVDIAIGANDDVIGVDH